ncbi:FtsK/SpoIIIE family DNA translocase [Clostridium polynesiense]|uniref:FtsK/SpoIIIE family DNA translocase n=1 Tax=Clostridium polynesiense TaxID=1325933 RepID=UPI00058C3E67|nr:DNA translocase FtsK [Clostridium polynesiense]
MSRKKKKRTTANKTKLNHEIKGIILITIGLLLIFALYYSNAGIIGTISKKTVFSLIGITGYLLPIIFIIYGINIIAHRGDALPKKKLYGISILLINSLLFIQMITLEQYYVSNSISDSFKNIIQSADLFHGGIIGLLLTIPFYKLFGVVGSFIIFSAIYVIAAIILFDISLYSLGENVKQKTKEVKKIRTANNGTAKSVEPESPKEINSFPSDEKSDYIKGINNKIKILDFMKSTTLEDNEPSEIVINEIPETKNEIEKPSSPAPAERNKSIDNTITEEVNKEISEKITSMPEEVKYEFPPVDLLKINGSTKMNKEDKKELLNNANKLEETLGSFGVDAKIIQVTKGPSVTRFELQPSPGVKVSKIVNLSDDIALSLAARGVRIEAPIPGKSAVGIEVPNRSLTAVFLREVLESKEYTSSSKNLAFALGKGIDGNCMVTDLSKMPHLLIAGATGSGKSVCINTLIMSLLYKYSPQEVKLLMIDPKVVELSIYNGIPHLLIPVVTDPKKAAGALNWAVNEMTRRYKLFAENGVRNIEGYNELFDKNKITEKLPWIVMIVDELADLMMACPHEVEEYIARLAQMARAAGMHLVIATQRPSVDVITGVIKANIPSRISFAVSSQIDSRTILDSSGAEKLLGRGDMLFYPVGESKPIRIQGAFISESEVEKVVNYIKSQSDEPEVNYQTEILEHIDNEVSSTSTDEDRDSLLDEAIRIVVEAGQASTSLLQRRLRIGYNRAARIMEQLEENRIISPRDGSKPRQVLISNENAEEY